MEEVKQEVKEEMEEEMEEIKEEIKEEVKDEVKEEMEEIKEEVKKEVEELIPQCAVVKEIRGKFIFTILVASNTVRYSYWFIITNAFFSLPLQYFTSL